MGINLLLSKSKHSALVETKRWAIMTFGLFVNAFAWVAFLIPGKIIGGGLTGVSTLIYYASENWVFQLPVSVTFFILNIFLIALAVKILGASFGVKTVYSVIMLSFFMAVLQGVLPAEGIMEKDAFLFAVIGGFLAGAGIGIVFTQGGSTGGTDIIAMIINKYHNVSPGRLILYMDVFIIASSYLVFKELSSVVYGFVTMAVVAWAIDLLISGKQESTQIFIFSKRYEEIANGLHEHVGRGITLLDGQGWYSRDPGKVVLIITRKHEMPYVLRIVKSIDSDAFVSAASVMGTFGKGFEHIRG